MVALPGSKVLGSHRKVLISHTLMLNGAAVALTVTMHSKSLTELCYKDLGAALIKQHMCTLWPGTEDCMVSRIF